MARQLLQKSRMRGFVIFLIIAGLGIVYLRHKHNEQPAIAPKSGTTQSVVKQPTPAQLTPAPRGQASEYNWMKRSLDRARDVTEKTRAQTKQSQEP
jgi:hypothetical protein